MCFAKICSSICFLYFSSRTDDHHFRCRFPLLLVWWCHGPLLLFFYICIKTFPLFIFSLFDIAVGFPPASICCSRYYLVISRASSYCSSVYQPYPMLSPAKHRFLRTRKPKVDPKLFLAIVKFYMIHQQLLFPWSINGMPLLTDKIMLNVTNIQ